MPRPSNGWAIHLSDSVKRDIDRFIKRRLTDIEQSKNEQWIYHNFQTAQIKAGLSLQTLSDHLMYMRHLGRTEKHSIRGYTRASSRVNHAHRPGFYNDGDSSDSSDAGDFFSTPADDGIRAYHVRRLNQIVMAAPALDAPATVFRKAMVHDFDFDWFCSRLGTVVKPWHDQLVSASFNGVIEKFTGIHFVISLPTGACGLTMIDKTMLEFSDDYEFLMPINSQFVVAKCEIDFDNRPVIHLQMIGTVKEPTPSGQIVHVPFVEELPPLTHQDLKDYLLTEFYAERL